MHILNYKPDDLKDKLTKICDKPFQVNQILQWIYLHHKIDFNEMTNLSLALRGRLLNELDSKLPEIIDIKNSSDKSIKFLLKLHDNNYIESVNIPSLKKNTLCISTQAGCARNCAFCATAKQGLKRNLTVDELLSQYIITSNHISPERITNIVLMGMGEPLDNFETVIDFLKILWANNGFDFSGRKTTVSTCGVVPMIDKLTELRLKFKLAVSLSSAIDEKRNILMPINKIYPLKELKRSLLSFSKKSSFRITFQYVMIDDFNMGKEDITALKKFCGDISCKINLIKWNAVSPVAAISGCQLNTFKSPSNDKIERFINDLKSLPVAITYRASKGTDISGACGQLTGGIV